MEADEWIFGFGTALVLYFGTERRSARECSKLCPIFVNHFADFCSRIGLYCVVYSRVEYWPMYSSKQCRDASEECHSKAKLAHSETEARVLRDLAHSWLRVANQTERYVNYTRDPKIHPEPGNPRVPGGRGGETGVMRLR